eukprot:CAMPEP_0113965316 /NCGR_PEP_ID=MMETSP0011_2-20120614/7673_1 /TAXON_ID=101924 /ORGANISM="Rhodosorus marinus" /LENGTH=83 /DNA_ID=CAMNT_0000977807 /DNA_START=1654 /DNA_END=1905 /DNA_ORIENTATION=- /assembly_acc=CAM_ASM_000156
MIGADAKIWHLSRETKENELQCTGVIDRPTRIALLHSRMRLQNGTRRPPAAEATTLRKCLREMARPPGIPCELPPKHASAKHC